MIPEKIEGLDFTSLPGPMQTFLKMACENRRGKFDILGIRLNANPITGETNGYIVIFYKQRDGYRDIVDVIETNEWT